MAEENNCETCPWRAKFDNKPKSLLGRLWRWHIGFCPGWKKYINAIDEDKQQELVRHYKLKVN